MQIRNRKNKKFVLGEIAIVLFILAFEITPSYYAFSETMVKSIISNFSYTDKSELLTTIEDQHRRQSQIQQYYKNITSLNSNNLSGTLEIFNTSAELNLYLLSIKPLNKKIEKGIQLNRINMLFEGSYEEIYNYFRWLNSLRIPMDIISVQISGPKNSDNLRFELAIDQATIL